MARKALTFEYSIKSWHQAAQILGKKLKFLVPIIEGLGRLDIELMRRDYRRPDVWGSESKERLEKDIFLSYLWVLSGYEVIRTFKQKSEQKNLFVNYRPAIARVKKEFEKLRVPLAKMEKHRQRGSSLIPVPFFLDGVVAWEVGKESITRDELATELLQLFLSFQFDNHCPQCKSLDTRVYAEDEWYLGCSNCGFGWDFTHSVEMDACPELLALESEIKKERERQEKLRERIFSKNIGLL